MYSDVVAGRASIVGAAATHVGKVREHNEDAHYIDVDLGLFLVCDGMGGHAAGEVASAMAIRSIRHAWASAGLHDIAEQWLERAWGYRYAGGTRTVDIHVRRVRSKLGDVGSIIETVRNVGYKMRG